MIGTFIGFMVAAGVIYIIFDRIVACDPFKNWMIDVWVRFILVIGFLMCVVLGIVNGWMILV